MAWTRRYEEAEPQRVNKWLGQSGVCSRREAEALIEKGLVSIDGERVTDTGRKILPGQTLTLADGGRRAARRSASCCTSPWASSPPSRSPARPRPCGC